MQIVLLLLQLLTCCALALPNGLDKKLQAVAGMEAAKYNCSISVAVRSENNLLAAAAGITDEKLNTTAKVTDMYAWGSITKMHTAAAVMSLVSKGLFTLDHTIGSLVDDVLGKMQKANPKQNFSKVSDLWGENITGITVRQLLAMQTGLPDFDTAGVVTPSQPAADPLRASVYKNPGHMDSPIELMSMPWVARQWNKCSAWSGEGPPGVKFCYSSTNFMLLGLVLAQQANVTDWKDFDQSQFLPDYLKKDIIFAKDGTPLSYGAVHGYDRTAYNVPKKGMHNNHDVGDVEGVFAGWTASNVIASASGLANLTWEIYRGYSFAPKPFIDLMLPRKPSLLHPISVYGLGTASCNPQTGQSGAYGEAYGHLGKTYGYESISCYFPGIDVSISVASNIETDSQAQPADTLCMAYNVVAGAILNQSVTCKYSDTNFYGGTCKCDKLTPPSASISV